MRLKLFRFTILGITSAVCLSVSPANAQASRTYVSGTGQDGNPCTAALPCKTLQTAIGQTAAGGEVYVLDSADYGGVIINKSITITSQGAVAGLLATTGTAIVINAGAADVVNLRGLDIDGAGSGTTGIRFARGQSLNVQRTTVRNFSGSGILFSGNKTNTLFISDTIVANNANIGIGIQAAFRSGALNAAVSRVTASSNGVGILASGSNVSLAITDTVSDNNGYGISASSSTVLVRSSTITHNGVGISADQSSIVSVTQSTLTANGIGWQGTNSGQVTTYGDNVVNGNAVDGTATTTIPLE